MMHAIGPQPWLSPRRQKRLKKGTTLSPIRTKRSLSKGKCGTFCWTSSKHVFTIICVELFIFRSLHRPHPRAGPLEHSPQKSRFSNNREESEVTRGDKAHS